MEPDTVAAVLEDHESAPISERLRAILGFLRRLTLEPGAVSGQDVAALRAAGLSDRAIEEAMYVMFAFNIIDRLADSFDFGAADEDYSRRTAGFLHRFGYRMASIPG